MTLGTNGALVRCAVLCTCITQLGRILLPNYQGSIINDLIAGNKEAGSDAGETTNTWRVSMAKWQGPQKKLLLCVEMTMAFYGLETASICTP